MLDQKLIPKGLCDQEVKRGHNKKPSIPYIPVENKIGNRVKGDLHTFKVKIGKRTTFNASIWIGGNQENFLIHVIGALNYCATRTNLFNKWMSAKKAKVKHNKDLKECRDYICMLYDVQGPPDPTETSKVPEEDPPSSKKWEEAQETLPKKRVA